MSRRGLPRLFDPKIFNQRFRVLILIVILRYSFKSSSHLVLGPIIEEIFDQFLSIFVIKGITYQNGSST